MMITVWENEKTVKHKKKRAINATQISLFCISKNNRCSIADEFYRNSFFRYGSRLGLHLRRICSDLKLETGRSIPQSSFVQLLANH
jgi:hypothetical protein